MKKSLIICSGGLDSTSMALLKKKEGNYIELMSFDYGQKGVKELEVSKELAEKLGCKFHLINLSAIKEIFGENQLTSDNSVVQDTYQKDIVVTLRNALFLQIASIYAVSNGFDEVVLGSHLDDCMLVDGQYAFPDCSPEFFHQFQKAVHTGILKEQKHIDIISASTMGLHKKDLIKIAKDIDSDILFRSWSCYKNEHKQCGECDSCRNRKKFFVESGIEDKTVYQK